MTFATAVSDRTVPTRQAGTSFVKTLERLQGRFKSLLGEGTTATSGIRSNNMPKAGAVRSETTSPVVGISIGAYIKMAKRWTSLGHP